MMSLDAYLEMFIAADTDNFTDKQFPEQLRTTPRQWFNANSTQQPRPSPWHVHFKCYYWHYIKCLEKNS